eukprot:1073196-Alexandrium_andersonii.AAC.1
MTSPRRTSPATPRTSPHGLRAGAPQDLRAPRGQRGRGKTTNSCEQNASHGPLGIANLADY